jgi:hypothetical protein
MCAPPPQRRTSVYIYSEQCEYTFLGRIKPIGMLHAVHILDPDTLVQGGNSFLACNLWCINFWFFSQVTQLSSRTELKSLVFHYSEIQKKNLGELSFCM